MVILRYSSFLCCLLLSSLSAETINYAKNDLHTQVIAKGKADVSLEYILLNDKIDIFKLKASEFSSTTTNLSSMGDTSGYGVALRYGLSDDLMVSIKHNSQDIEYLSETMTNQKNDVYFRYNLFHDNFSFFNSGVSIDIGYIQNKLDDFYLKDISSINAMIKRVLPNQNASLIYADGVTTFPGEPFPRPKGYYAKFNNTTAPLSVSPYISMTQTQDDSFYVRALTGFYDQYQIFDVYIGYKQTTIKNKISTTQEIQNIATSVGYNLTKILDRDEAMAFFGFNYARNVGDFIYEFNYEYDKFYRDAGLDYVNFNHVINASVSYIIRKDLIASVGAKILYRQLNGEVPYLYNAYTQTTFDHKYGYATFGVQYSF